MTSPDGSPHAGRTHTDAATEGRPVTDRTPDRRTVLRGLGTAATLSLAGCLDAVPSGVGGSSDVVLDPPESERGGDADLPYPTRGEQLPEASVPAALADREVTTTEFVGERHVMLTFVFARCSMTCPMLTATLSAVQSASIEDGFAEEFAFLPTTFDPVHDTPAVLAEYGAERGVEFEAGNWWFLRPRTEARAEAVVTDTFGVFFKHVPEAEREVENMAYIHNNLVLLVNADGYVERAYGGDPPNPGDVVEDARTLHDRW